MDDIENMIIPPSLTGQAIDLWLISIAGKKIEVKLLAKLGKCRGRDLLQIHDGPRLHRFIDEMGYSINIRVDADIPQNYQNAHGFIRRLMGRELNGTGSLRARTRARKQSFYRLFVIQ